MLHQTFAVVVIVERMILILIVLIGLWSEVMIFVLRPNSDRNNLDFKLIPSS